MTDRPSRSRHPTRRDILALGAGAFVLSTLPLMRRRSLVRRTVPIMGTVGEIVVVHGDRPYAQAAIGAAFDELRRVERLMTRFTSHSDVGRINRAPTLGVVVADDTAGVIERALHWAHATGGRFDPCLGRAAALWDVTERSAPPAQSEYARFAGQAFYRSIDLDRHNGSAVVRLGHPDAAVDLGGITKGYGVDRAVAVLRDWGIRDAIVNVGGDLYGMGSSADGDPWHVGVRSPLDPNRVLRRIDVEDRAVATSGDYLQYFDYRGHRYHHILDARSAAPRVVEWHSLTVSAGSCVEADAAATAAFGLAGPDAQKLVGTAVTVAVAA